MPAILNHCTRKSTKHAHLGRQVAAVRIDGKDAAALGHAVVEHRRPAGRPRCRAAAMKSGRMAKPSPETAAARAAIGLLTSIGPETETLISSRIVADERPVGQPAAVGVDDAGQLGRGPAAGSACRVFSISSGEPQSLHRERRQPPRDQRRAFQPGDADGQVEAFLDQVDEAVVEMDLQHDVRMLLGEIDQRLADRRIGEGARRRKLDAAAHVAGGFAHRVGRLSISRTISEARR